MASKKSFKIFLSRRITFVDSLNLCCNSRCFSTLAEESSASKNVKPFDEIPGPTAVPVLGTLWQYYSGELPFIIQQKNFMKYGPMYRERMGNKTYLQVSDIAAFRDIFKIEGKSPERPIVECWKEYRKWRNMPTGIPNVNGEEWVKTRRAFGPKMLRPKELKDNTDSFNEVIVDFLKELRKTRNEKNEVLDFGSQVTRWSTESIGTYIFDARLGLFEDPPNRDALDLIKGVQAFITETGALEFIFPLYKYISTPAWKRFSAAQDAVFAVGKKFINNKLEQLKSEMDENGNLSLEGPTTLLTYLLAKKELPFDDLIAGACDVLFGGVDTTATMVTWILHCVISHPHAQEKIYEEVTSVLKPGQLPTYADLQKMPYMKACVKETLRLYPPVFNLGRIIMENTSLCGYEIPAGTTIMLNFYSTSRSEEHFEDPLEFKPERWLRSDADKKNTFLSLPFGHGARMCLGRRVAETEVYLLMALMFREFKCEYVGEPMGVSFRFFISPDKPLKVRFNDRN